ncbi:MAG TPA: hypothetical protein VEU94_02555 [Terriglobales bacterium]|nr:hypothetical protein [Terriglobales bacterium]
MGRFLMIMLASGGYPWTVVPVKRRDDFLKDRAFVDSAAQSVPLLN